MTAAYLPGFLLGLGLIVAIGAQNAFVLRQGLRREHVLAVCLVCALSDACLIAAGVAGFGALARGLPWLGPMMRYGGAAFLAAYACRSLVSALGRGAALLASDGVGAGLPRTLVACLAFTWLNPHVYLDTLVLVGSVSTRYAADRVGFALGAVSASFLFFFALGYGARLLRPLFAAPLSWRVLDGAIAIAMAAISLNLVVRQ